MPSPAWMPIYWADYHKKTQHLSIWQHGAYLLILSNYWMVGEAPHKSKIAYIIRSNTKNDRELREVLQSFFEEDSSGFLHNKRMDKEIKESQRIIQVRKKASKLGVKARQPYGQPCGQPNDNHLVRPSPSPKDLKKEGNVSGGWAKNLPQVNTLEDAMAAIGLPMPEKAQ